MFKKPIINIQIKPSRSLNFLYDFDFCHDMLSGDKEKDNNVTIEDFKKTILEIESKNYDYEFAKCTGMHLFKHGNVSEQILKEVLK